MAKSAWFRGPVCGTDNCRSRIYRSTDGLTICQFGHVLEGAVEFNDDQDQAVVSTRRLNAAVMMDSRGSFASSQPLSRSQSLTQRDNERLFGREALTMYYRCLQLLLKCELENFIKLFGSESMTHDLTVLVKTNWINVLSSVEKDSDENMDNHIDTLDLIVIVYVSALQLRGYPIYTSDILEKITTGEIPYVRTLHLLPRDMLDKLPTVFHNRLQPYNLPTRNQIYKKLKNTLNRINLDLQIPLSFYFPFIFHTYYQKLILPNAPELFMITYQLLLQQLDINKFDIKHKSKQTTTFLESIPEIYLSSIMIFIIRLSFYTKTNKYSIQTWLTQLTQESANDFISDNILDWSDSKIENYCDWIYEYIIPKKFKLNEQQEKLTTLEKRLFQIFKLENDEQEQKNYPLSSSSSTPDMREILNKLSTSSNYELSNQDFEKLELELFSKFSKILGVDENDLMKCYEVMSSDIKKKTMHLTK